MSFKMQLDSMSEEITLRCLTLEDEIWIQNEYPNYHELITTEKVDMGCLTGILYRCIESKNLFSKITESYIDDNGDEKTRSIGGLNLFRRHITTEADQIACMLTFAEVCNKSRPENKDDGVKKKTLKRKKLTYTLFSTFFALVTIGAIVKLWGLP